MPAEHAEGYASSALEAYRRMGDEQDAMRAEAVLPAVGMMREMAGDREA